MKNLLTIGAAAIAVCGMCLTASAEDGYVESEGIAAYGTRERKGTL